MTSQFSSILFHIKNEFQHIPEAEKHECTEYNLQKLSFQLELISKKIQQSEKFPSSLIH